MLIYAKLNMLRKYKPHLVVPLEACGLVEVDPAIEQYALLVGVARVREQEVTTDEKNIFLVFKDAREQAQWTRWLRVAVGGRTDA